MHSLAVADFLPNLTIPSMPNGNPVHLRDSGGKTTVLVMMHSADCVGCRDYVAWLASSAAEFDVWDGRLLVVVPGEAAMALRLHTPFGKVLADEHAHLAQASNAAVVIADRYGHVFEAVHAGASHRLPSPREIEEWLKYLGTLCPE